MTDRQTDRQTDRHFVPDPDVSHRHVRSGPREAEFILVQQLTVAYAVLIKNSPIIDKRMEQLLTYNA